MRNPRYKFTFVYVTENKNGKMMYGNIEEKLMNYIDLETVLKVLSPLKCKEWIDRVCSLGRNGYVVFELDGMEELKGNTIRLKKLMRIQRN